MITKRWKRYKHFDKTWYRLSLSNDQYVSICDPGPNPFCTQWFVALCRESGAVIDSTYTSWKLNSHGPLTARRAKRWARAWAEKLVGTQATS